MTPLAFVGDIHGDASRLEQLLTRAPEWGRPLIFLGDYVNRGPQSSQVLELVEIAVAQGHIALLGNHDHAFQEYLRGTLSFSHFTAMGGASTIRSYAPDLRGDVLSQMRATVPPRHVQLLDKLLPFWESTFLLASHAGYNPSRPESRTVEDMALRGHPSIFRTLGPASKLVICGHYTQTTYHPHLSERVICLDTACGSGGPLTALLWPELDFVQF